MYRKISIVCLLVSVTLLLSFDKNNSGTIPSKSKENHAGGWKTLFNGKDLTGWRTYQNKEQNSWEVVDGQLHCKKDATKHCDILTLDEYDNFELEVDWKIDKASNSGIIYRCNEKHGAPYETGPEYQLIDDAGYPEKLEDWQKSGSDYAMHPPSKLAAKPAGEYNHTKIVVKGKHVEHWLNGVKVVEFEFWTPEWKKLKEAGKWKDEAEYGMLTKGHIDLQDHGGGVWFKNIRVRSL
ncbi:MAG: DUF1080 domain-containing protein [Bacteroidetes bacterium]|nr:MAG: DUF1080 domain-containing protein [Bacteroidota bacterium]